MVAITALGSIDIAVLRATVFGAPGSTPSKALAGSEGRPFCSTVQSFAVFGDFKFLIKVAVKRRKLIGGRISKSAIFWVGMRRHLIQAIDLIKVP